MNNEPLVPPAPAQDTRVDRRAPFEPALHHMESDRESNAALHPTTPRFNDVDPTRANWFSPLSAESRHHPSGWAIPKALMLVGVAPQGESDTDSLEILGTPAGDHMGSQDEVDAQPAVMAPVVRDVAEDELLVTRDTRDASLVGRFENDLSSKACIMRSPRFVSGNHRAADAIRWRKWSWVLMQTTSSACVRGGSCSCPCPECSSTSPSAEGWCRFDRFVAFTRGEWTELLIASRGCAEAAAQGCNRRQRTHQARSALKGPLLEPCKIPVNGFLCPLWWTTNQTASFSQLDQERFLKNLRSSRTIRHDGRTPLPVAGRACRCREVLPSVQKIFPEPRSQTKFRNRSAWAE